LKVRTGWHNHAEHLYADTDERECADQTPLHDASRLVNDSWDTQSDERQRRQHKTRSPNPAAPPFIPARIQHDVRQHHNGYDDGSAALLPQQS